MAMPTDTITSILGRIQHGDTVAPAELLTIVYQELHQMASRQMDHERSDHTLQPTALVNEAYLRLLGNSPAQFENRAHFFGAAAEAMRRILVDHARNRLAAKRGGGRDRVPLGDLLDSADQHPADLIAVDEAVTKLAQIDPQKRRIVELRFFVGMTAEETARALDLSIRTVLRDWRFAKAWLYRELGGDDAQPATND